MTRSRLTKLCAAVMVVAATLASPVMTQSASAGTPTCMDPGTRVPVILVHGLNGSEADFTAHANGAESLIKRLGTIPNVFTDLFDYSSVADQWVKNAGIGQALADRIGCLAAKSKAAGGIGKVIIVAHSMGGLAAREAMSLNYTATNAPVGPSVGLLVTVATPNTGSWSDALFHNVRSGGGGVRLSELTWLAQGICGSIGAYTGPKRPGICGILQGSTSDAGTAMIPGSHELAKLPPPPTDLPVDAVAGQLTVTTTLFGVHKTYTVFPSGQLGDILVKTDSALAYGSGAGRQHFVQPCTLSVSQVWNGQGWNGCTHGGLLYDPTVGEKITSWVQSWVEANTQRAPVAVAPDVSAFVGSWNIHAGGLTIASDGTGTMTFRDYSNVPNASGPGVAFPSLGIVIASVNGGVALAKITTSNTPMYPVGSTLTLTLAWPGIVVTGGVTQSFCSIQNDAHGVCGVDSASNGAISASTTTQPPASTSAANCPASTQVFADLVNANSSSGSTSTVTHSACQSPWAIVSGITSFTSGGSPEGFVALLASTSGQWSLIAGPDDGSCMAASSTAQCPFPPSPPLPIPSATLTSLAQQAGLTIDSSGNVSTGT